MTFWFRMSEGITFWERLRDTETFWQSSLLWTSGPFCPSTVQMVGIASILIWPIPGAHKIQNAMSKQVCREYTFVYTSWLLFEAFSILRGITSSKSNLQTHLWKWHTSKHQHWHTSKRQHVVTLKLATNDVYTISVFGPEVCGTSFFKFGTESGILPMSKWIRDWIRDSKFS